MMPLRGTLQLAIIAYDSHAKVYTPYYASSAGNTWTWMGKTSTRATMLSPTQYTSKYEVADGKGGYTTIVEGKATKIRP